MNENKRWREGCGRPCGYGRRVFRMLIRASSVALRVGFCCGGAAAESRTSLERPCWVSKPGAGLKARTVWRSPQLGSSWIKDGSEVSIWKATNTAGADEQIAFRDGTDLPLILRPRNLYRCKIWYLKVSFNKIQTFHFDFVLAGWPTSTDLVKTAPLVWEKNTSSFINCKQKV